jgi:aspartate dehydrogenase
MGRLNWVGWRRISSGLMISKEQPPEEEEMAELTVGLMGYGAIGQPVAEAIRQGEAGPARLVSILVRQPGNYQPPAGLGDAFTADWNTFMAAKPSLVIEAAGQPALRQYGLPVLAAGADLLVTSMGAFTDEGFYQALIETATAQGRRIYLASGALPAVDWLASVAPAGVHQVTITQSKPIKSWVHTAAAEMIDLHSLTEPTIFFAGSAREAASRFPKSSNITAMLALITAGLDQTRVNLIADPVTDDMKLMVEFAGEAGHLKVERRGQPAALNPSTGADVPLNVIKAVRNLTATVCLGP